MSSTLTPPRKSPLTQHAQQDSLSVGGRPQPAPHSPVTSFGSVRSIGALSSRSNSHSRSPSRPSSHLAPSINSADHSISPTRLDFSTAQRSPGLGAGGVSGAAQGGAGAPSPRAQSFHTFQFPANTLKPSLSSSQSSNTLHHLHASNYGAGPGASVSSSSGSTSTGGGLHASMSSSYPSPKRRAPPPALHLSPNSEQELFGQSPRQFDDSHELVDESRRGSKPSWQQAPSSQSSWSSALLSASQRSQGRQPSDRDSINGMANSPLMAGKGGPGSISMPFDDEPEQDEEHLNRDYDSRFDSASSVHPSQSTSTIGAGSSPADAPRQWTGLGLGMPFSHSHSTHIAAQPTTVISSPRSPLSPRHQPGSSSTQRSSSGERSGSAIGPESPVTDRSNLVGLGELATPRWATAGARRWGTPNTDNDAFGPHDPMPARSFPSAADSPTMTHKPVSLSFSSVRVMPNLLAGAPHQPSLFPSSDTTQSLVSLAAPTSTGLLSFGQDQSKLEMSPSYSLDAISIPDDEDDDPTASYARRPSAATAASSAPASAASGSSWIAKDRDVVGLGLDYPASGAGPVEPTTPGSSSSGTPRTRAANAGLARRRSVDSNKERAHRRQSTSKSSFAHLPPSPAAPQNANSFKPLSDAPPPPPFPGSAPHTPQTAQASPQATRTPDLARLSQHSSNHSHHSSPSIIAASILRQTREIEPAYDAAVDEVAAKDEGTAEALRKLDGLSSPRMSRVLSSSTGPGADSSPSKLRERKVSKDVGSPPSAQSRRSSASETKRRMRTSTGGSTNAGLAKETESARLSFGSGQFTASPAALQSPTMPSTASQPQPSSSHSSQPSIPRSPLSHSLHESFSSSTTPKMSTTAILPPAATESIPFPVSSPFKRGSSASLNAGTTSTSTFGSHDSMSNSSFATTAPRSVSSKNRRSSAGSDVSSVHSSSEGQTARLDNFAAQGNEPSHHLGSLVIPPVPPIPQAYETVRASPSSAQNSPRLDQSFSRRPSETSEFADSSMLSPRSADMDFSWSQGSQPATKAQPRKWSFSNAFSKAGKSPKSTIQESASFSDLQSHSAERERLSSFGSQASGASGWKRMAASSNDIAALSNSTSSNSLAAAGGSLGRSTGKLSSSMMSRARTESTSSSSTALAGSRADNNQPPPELVTTSPGRSRSSLLSPRRPSSSGIPFFSRKASSGSVTATPSPNLSRRGSVSPVTPANPPEEREKPSSSGRKSILGINFLSRKDKKDKEKAPPSPALSSHTASSASSIKSPQIGQDEFGRRASVASKTSSLITRKRGKTVGSKDEPAQSARQASLPPMQMPALSSATVKRVDSLSKNTTPTSHRVAPLSTRANKLQESVKGNLPTIAGSPSTYGRTQPSAEEVALRNRSPSESRGDSNTSPPKSHTPTRIPRLYTQKIVPPTTSPKLGYRREASSAASSRGPSPATATKATRRLSSNSLFGTSSAAGGEADLSASTNELAPLREPGLAPGEKTLSTRRRLESSESSGIPRSKSTVSGLPLASSTARKESTLSSSTASSMTPSSTMAGLPRVQRRTSLAAEDKLASGSVPGRAPGAAARTSSLIGSKSNASSSDSSSATSTGTARRVSVKPAEVLSQSTSAVQGGPRRASAAPTTSATTEARASRGIASKMSLPARMTRSSTTGSLNAAPSESGRSSSASFRPAVSEEELRGDEEMGQYVRRQQAKKMAAGVPSDVVRKMFDFPEPTEPLPALAPKEALSLYNRYLSPYERDEIHEYKSVYFVGPNSDKKQASKDHPTNNFGYDDERGDYLLVPHDHIVFRYEAIDVLGKGSFGQVLQCRDHKTGQMVAIKMIRNKKRFHHQALVEIKVLENLLKWDPDEKHFVIRMVDSFSFRGHLCIVTELLSINLYELVKANSFAGFSTVLLRRFTQQILGSLSLLRHQRVVHCDLKPENILLKHPAKSAIKVIDFGSSCFESEKVYTYIQSRFYRSPEVILGMNYHMAIDMWSLGCIIAEMYTGYPIFPGENEQEQLACIMEVLGLPDKYLIDRSSRKRLFFDSTGAPRPVVNSKGRRRRPGTKSLAQVLKTDDEQFLDFIAKCLIWDPDRRLKPDPAMRHPFILQAKAGRASPAEQQSASRSTRSSLAASVASSSTAAGSSSSSSPKIGTISTPRKVVPAAAANASATTSQAASMPRTRTMSHLVGGSAPAVSGAGPARLTSKGSSQLPQAKAYAVHP